MKVLQNLPLVLTRVTRFAWATTVSLAEYFIRLLPFGRCREQLELAKWCQRTSLRMLRSLGISVESRGTLPDRGMVACNHLSYLDILVLAATAPSTFISKYQVKFWPVFGWFGILSGTLFLRRERKSHAVEVSNQFGRVIESGALLTVFPEGTSTNGRVVKPFHSTLFQPAAKQDWKVTPAWLTYEMEAGQVEREVCFIDDMLFLPHFLNLLACRNIRACLIYGDPAPSGLQRKEIARYLHDQVCRLAVEHSGCERFANPRVESEKNPTVEIPAVNPG